LINKRQHSSTTDVKPFRGADRAIDHNFMVAKVSKQAIQKYDMERFKLNKLKMWKLKKTVSG
jgi:hypothetical protein